ncbi:hypothetical protein A8924_5848 [Saccharopolyspora erythraea NRRL 2338]|nr:type VII secretion system-associated protein [Saccharopolyspora erythraea]EQD82328.1 hypothetical protein N599_31290 [Saccharopolyspora erythraea D]PFG98339.1 hypothetical protein A8924_5848 [Saccharopolyspora erythraea NRRL 2338]
MAAWEAVETMTDVQRPDSVDTPAPPGEAGERNGADAAEKWFLLMDPAWSPTADEPDPPVSAIVGVWPLEDGAVGKFRPNPGYEPSDENSPSDPVDAVLRMMVRASADADQLRLILRDSVFDLAMNGDGRPLVTRSPDDVLCAVVATSEPHRLRITSPSWRRVDIDELVELLADDADVLFNPGGPATVRLVGGFIRSVPALTDDEVAEMHDKYVGDLDGRVEVMPWQLDEDSTPEAEQAAKL